MNKSKLNSLYYFDIGDIYKYILPKNFNLTAKLSLLKDAMYHINICSLLL
jgi:hypothetical protein